MSKRYTIPEKWRDKWFETLSVLQKLTFIYLCEACDMAGFWEINYRRAAFDIGVGEVEIEGAMKGLTRGFLSNDKYLWIINFLYHQNNLPLNNNNPCHKGILKIIKSHNSFGDIVLQNIEKQIKERSLVGALKGLGSPTCNSNSKGNSKEGCGGKVAECPSPVVNPAEDDQSEYQKLMELWAAKINRSLTTIKPSDGEAISDMHSMYGFDWCRSAIEKYPAMTARQCFYLKQKYEGDKRPRASPKPETEADRRNAQYSKWILAEMSKLIRGRAETKEDFDKRVAESVKQKIKTGELKYESCVRSAAGSITNTNNGLPLSNI